MAERSQPRVAGGSTDDIQGDPRVDLVLYVSPNSGACLRAANHIRQLLAMFKPTQVRFEVRDLSQSVSTAEEDHVIFTPTLVKRRPDPPAWFVGDRLDRDMLSALLVSWGVEKSE
jgi:KaiB domain